MSGRKVSRGTRSDLVWQRLLEALADPVRVRMVRLISGRELSVGELARVLQLPQSTASRHLACLGAALLTQGRRQGTARLYQLSSSLATDGQELIAMALGRASMHSTGGDDDSRLAAVLAERRVAGHGFIGKLGQGWDALRGQLFGDRFADEGMLALLDPTWCVADVGCGTGQVAARIAPFVRKVVAIDRERAMIDACRARLAPHANAEVRCGDLSRLPATPAEFDAVIAVLVFHHIPRPSEVMGQLSRALRPGGKLLVIDMVPHVRHDYRTTMDHAHL
ncbi:MAG: metalloregulator ArsR/SmtB family transcription factor, partial [Phycisphaerales bacterium]|nr:metalloregulator ArsR/SmtB family transcription factor [Phycisphaerales bacterium]